MMRCPEVTLLGSNRYVNPFTSTLAPVWQNPSSVWIDLPALESTATRIAGGAFPTPAWREDVFPRDDLQFLDFIGIGNAINFAFTTFDTRESFAVEFRGVRWRGAFAMWACLQRALDQGVDMVDGKVLQQITLSEIRDLFRGQPAIPLLHERWTILQQIGRTLCERYNGRFRNFFRESEARAFGPGGYVTKLLEHFPSFRDESTHHSTGAVLRFEKRAQLLAMMYQGRATSADTFPELADSAELGPIADYGVPRALHSLGILRYDSLLESQILAGQLVEKDSAAEQEIRAQAIQAQLLLLDRINRLRSERITFVQLDYGLWTLGRGVDEPHHMTITTAY